MNVAVRTVGAEGQGPSLNERRVSTGKDLTARQVPGYTIDRLLGRGNVGSAYLARGHGDERQIVLKVIELGTATSREQLKRFMVEYRVLARLTHPHVVCVEERGFAPDYAFIAMEYCAHGTLRQRIGAGLPAQQALRYLHQLVAGLQAVHEIDVLHRDLKPSNLLFCEPEHLVLTDFGVAKDLRAVETLTAHGTFPGSVYYVSPEQIQHQHSSALSDLYSVGVILYQMVTGKPPYVGERAIDVLDAHVKAPLPRLPPHLSAMQPLLDGLLAKDPCERFQSCADLASAITWTQCKVD